jgi:hypothetical protein
MKKRYVITKVFPWSAVKLVGPTPFPTVILSSEDGVVGFMPVFETREAAIFWNGSEDHIGELHLEKDD